MVNLNEPCKIPDNIKIANKMIVGEYDYLFQMRKESILREYVT